MLGTRYYFVSRVKHVLFYLLLSIPLEDTHCMNVFLQGRKLRISMSVAVADGLRVLHTIPGRLRVHMPEWEGKGKRGIETELRQLQGVQSVQANALTCNVLVQYDPTLTNEQTILATVSTLELNRVDESDQPPPSPPPTVREKQGGTVRARIAIRGLDRDPHLPKRILQHLESRYPKVRASASTLTGRMLVEFEEHEAELDDLIAEVANFDLPDIP